jgi:hypothetical protein
VLRDPILHQTREIKDVLCASRLRRTDAVSTGPREPGSADSQVGTARGRDVSLYTSIRRVEEKGLSGARLPLASVFSAREMSGALARDRIASQLHSRPNQHPTFQVDERFLAVSPSISQIHSLIRVARACQIDPIDDPGKRLLAVHEGVDRAANRTPGHHEVVGSVHARSCRSATHLCQVGTTSRNRTIEIQFPQPEISTEIENRKSQPAVGRYETAAGPQHEPPFTVCCKHVEGTLKPISTATTDEQVGQASDSECRPGPQVNSFVDFRLTILLNASEVLFENGEAVLHEYFQPPEIWHNDCL